MASQQEQNSTTFAVARHGFDRTQVKQYLQRIEQDGLRLAAERDEARAHADAVSAQLEAARQEIATLNARLSKIGVAAAAASSPSAQERAARTVDLAKAQASEITERAQTSADSVWSAAEEASSALRDRYRRLLADLDRQHGEIHAEHKSIMESARARVHDMTTVADLRRKESDDAAERERQRIESQFEQEVSAKRDTLRREIEAAQSASAEEARRRVREATDEAAKRIATATGKVERLTALRDQVAGRLRGTHDLLTESAALLEPLESEAELADGPAKPGETIPVARPRPAKTERTKAPAAMTEQSSPDNA